MISLQPLKNLAIRVWPASQSSRVCPNLPRHKCSWMRQARRKTPALDAPCRIANRAPQRCNHSNQQSICGSPGESVALSVSVGLFSSYSGHRTVGNCSCVRDVARRILPTAASLFCLYASVHDEFDSSLEATTDPVHQRTTPGTKAGSVPHRPSYPLRQWPTQLRLCGFFQQFLDRTCANPGAAADLSDWPPRFISQAKYFFDLSHG